mmetsp:Transcript_76653/g.135244  ORF Transcript_76653/g.135244 Transcript_76653/m.135244 type:complete len:455 (-) Transcript_76653:84-1448(-)
MDGGPPGGDDGSVKWFYLDSVGKEFGPFPNGMMREWYAQGFFPLGEQLQIRLPQWSSHALLKHVYPDVSEAFIGLPMTGPPVQAQPSQQLPPMENYRGGFENSQYQGQPQDGFLGRRPAEDMPPPPYPQGQQPIGPHQWMLPNGQSGYEANSGIPMPGGGMQNNLLGVGGMQGCGMQGIPGRGPDGIGNIQQNVGMGGCMGMGGQGAGNIPNRLLSQLNKPSPTLEGAGARGPFDGGGYDQGGFGCAGMQQLQMQQHLQLPNAQGQGQAGMPFPGGLHRYRGRIKSFNKQHGFGFIESGDAFAHFGRDVFLHKAQIGNLKVGTEVTYGVDMNKQGMPQARDLFTIDGLPPGPAPPQVAKGGTKPKSKGKGKGGKASEQSEGAEVAVKGKKGGGRGRGGKNFVAKGEQSQPFGMVTNEAKPVHSAKGAQQGFLERARARSFQVMLEPPKSEGAAR